MSEQKQNVVVIGGGYGANVARELAAKIDPAKYKVILINPLPYRIHLPACARLAVTDEGKLEEQVFLPYDRALPDDSRGTFVQGTVTAIEKSEKIGGHVVLKDGERIPFRILVLATGSKWNPLLDFPDDPVKVTEKIAESRAMFKNAKKVVIVGGGAVGIELSGEIKDTYPDTEITIIQGDDALLNKAYPVKFRKSVERSVTSRGVKVVLGEFAENLPDTGFAKTVTTRSGKTFDADVVISARGPKPNTSFIISSLGSGVAADNGRIKVLKTLQLPDHQDIFAMGDIVDIDEQKQAAKANFHSPVIVTNILSLLQEKKAAKEYKPMFEMILVTNGKNGGRAYMDVLWGIMLGDWAARLLKAKSLLIPMFKTAQGY